MTTTTTTTAVAAATSKDITGTGRGEKHKARTLSRWEDVISKKTMTMTRSGRKGRTDVSVCTCPPSFPRGRSKCGCVAVYVCFRLFPVRCLIKFSWPPLMVDFIFKNKQKTSAHFDDHRKAKDQDGDCVVDAYMFVCVRIDRICFPISHAPVFTGSHQDFQLPLHSSSPPFRVCVCVFVCIFLPAPNPPPGRKFDLRLRVRL